MLVVNHRGLIVETNKQLEQLFGYSRAELVNQPVEQLVPGPPEAHREHHAAYLSDPTLRPMGAGRDLFGRHRDGTLVPVEIGLTPMRTADGSFVLASVIDLSERKRAQAQLEASLAEKETLLRELHHRAKNNLALIASLLDLASSRPGPEVLAECRERIGSISLVHELLYQSETVSHIRFDAYVKTLGEQVAHAWAPPQGPRVEFVVDVTDLTVSLEQAVPCGLILNELLTNAWKHAFPERAGTITVRVRRQGSVITLEVKDDGVGMPADAVRTARMGLALVDALTRQLRGTLDTKTSAGGTHVTLTFEGAP